MTRRTYGSKRGREAGPPFVQIFHWMTESAAWRDLGPVPQAVYLALKRYYTGTNNGMIGLSCRQAADATGVHYSTTSRALQKLVDHGFIVEATKGVVGSGSGYNLATEWLLDECRDDRNGTPAKKRFMQWSKNKNTVAESIVRVAPVQPDGTLIPRCSPARSGSATSKRVSAENTLHGRNTLTSSHGQDATDETRGAAGPREQSKPRVARTGLVEASLTSYPIGGHPPAGFVSVGPTIDIGASDVGGPIHISAALRSILREAGGKAAPDPEAEKVEQ